MFEWGPLGVEVFLDGPFKGQVQPQGWVIGKLSVHAFYFSGNVSFGLGVKFVGWRCRLRELFGVWINAVVAAGDILRSVARDNGRWPVVFFLRFNGTVQPLCNGCAFAGFSARLLKDIWFKNEGEAVAELRPQLTCVLCRR